MPYLQKRTHSVDSIFYFKHLHDRKFYHFQNAIRNIILVLIQKISVASFSRGLDEGHNVQQFPQKGFQF